MKKVISWITGMLLLLSTAACGGPVSAATDLSGSGTESSQDSVPDQNSEENSGVEEETIKDLLAISYELTADRRKK